MFELILAAALAQAASAPDPCNAAGRATQPLPGCTIWEPVRRNADGDGYVDPTSARRDGDHVEVNVRLLLDAPVENAHSIQTRFRLNCVARTARQVHLAAFDASGRVIAQGAAPDDAPRPVRPDTPYADLLDRFCRR